MYKLSIAICLITQTNCNNGRGGKSSNADVIIWSTLFQLSQLSTLFPPFFVVNTIPTILCGQHYSHHFLFLSTLVPPKRSTSIFTIRNIFAQYTIYNLVHTIHSKILFTRSVILSISTIRNIFAQYTILFTQSIPKSYLQDP